MIDPSLSAPELIASLEDLTQEPGFLYSLAILLRTDLFLHPDEADFVDWSQSLSFEEIVFLTGLMVKHEVRLDLVPTREQSQGQIERGRELFQKLHGSYTSSLFEAIMNLKGDVEKVDSNDSDQPFYDLFDDGKQLVEPMFYGGSGAYGFQYLDLAPKKYHYDEAWIQTNKGISIGTMTQLTAALKALAETKARQPLDDEDFESYCRACLTIFCFSYKDFDSMDQAQFRKVVDAFAVAPGQANDNFDSIGAYNVIQSSPIICLKDDLYFLPVHFALAQSIYESPFYWMGFDEAYQDIAAKNRGQALEELAFGMLANVFGGDAVHKGVQVYRKGTKESITDIDVLAIAGNKALIVQAKSKKLTVLSRMGHSESLKRDFKAAIQDAYEQGVLSRHAVIQHDSILVTDDGETLALPETLDDAYIICLTSDHYPAVTHQIDVFLDRKSDGPYALALNIFDLEIVAHYLSDRFDFLYYLRQRVDLIGHFKASSEITYLAYHLNQKLFPKKGLDKQLLPETWAQLIDANYPAARGFQPKTIAATRLHHQWKNKKFDRLVDQITATKHPRLADALFFLFDLAGDGADDLIKRIEDTKRQSLRDGRPHDFTLLFDGEERGITYMSLPDAREDLERRLMVVAVARKYKSKANEWLGLGSSVKSNNLVDTFFYDKEPWKEDADLGSLVQTTLKPGRIQRPDGQKVGRNNPCPCGSGLKFKKCHGS